MSWFSRKFGKEASVAYYTWHAGSAAERCGKARELDGTCWVPEKDFKGPPLKDGCTMPGGCTCRALAVRVDEAWGPGNAAWIRKRNGLDRRADGQVFLSS